MHYPVMTERQVNTAWLNKTVGARLKVPSGGCGYFLGLIYVVIPKLSRYSMGLR